ncbi:uncharacterized protein [Maniola hyperantus]|uniref:uncharacterized protein isoform X30 n=1 Tax=Aphantopus hyperantus TaxID=2795564 RepID=UPI00374794B7
MDYVPTPAAAFQSSAQRISRVFACLQSSISSMHHITRSTCLGELPASLCHCASQKSCRPWSSWPACQYSAGIRSLPRRAACHLLSSRGLRPWSSCQPACILQASVRAGASCVPSPCHREIFVPGRAASLPAFCRHPFVPGRASVPSPSIARSSCLVELPACLQVCKRPFVPRRASCHLLSSRDLRAWSSCQPACILQASARAVASCVPESCHRASQDLRAWSAASLPAFCRHPFCAGANCVAESCHRASQDLRAWSSCQPACILQASARAVASCVPESCHRASQGLRAWSSCQPACILQASVRARASCVPEILPSRIARSPCLVKLPACLHSAGIRSRWGKLRGRLLPSRIARSSVPGRAASLPAFCRHPFVPGRAACHHLSSRDLRIWSSCQPACILQSSARAVVSCVPDSCHHASQSLRAWSSYQPACILQASARAVASCVPDSCHHASQGLRAWSSYQPACILQASARAVASGVPESCHRASQGLHAWSSCQPACRLLPSRIAKSPCLVELPACLHSAGIRSCQGELRARILPSRIARSPCLVKLPACLHSAGIRSRWGKLRGRLLPSRIARSPCLVELPACLHSAGIRSCQGELRAITCHREIFVSGRAVSLPAFCSHPSVPGRASCHLLSSRGLRAWSSCQPACILQASVRARASCVPSPVIARIFVSGSSCQPACIPAVIRSCCGELRARLLPSRIAKSPCTGQATSLPAFCRHPLVLWRAACQNPAIAHRTVSMPGRAASLPADSCHHASQSLRAWSSYQPACILQASARAVASCVPDSCHRASQDLRAWSSCQPACILQASARAVASCVPESCHRASQDLRAWSAASLPAFCRHPFALGQTAWQTPAIAHRKVSVPGRAASLPAFCRHPFVPGRAACHHLSSRDLRIWSSCQPACILQSSARAVVSCVPDSCHHASQSLRAWSSYQPACILQGIRSCCGELRAITCHREIFVSGRAVSLPAFCSHPSVPGRASCHLLSSRGLRAWSSCQPACIFAGIRSQPGRAACQNPAIAHRKISVPGQAVSLPAFCRHPFVPWRAACQTPAIAHRKIFRAWSSFQPACILQASVRARASCVPESCHRAS